MPAPGKSMFKSLVEVADSLGEKELIELAVEQASWHNSRIRRLKVQTKQIVKAIERNRVQPLARSNFPSSEYPFLIEDVEGRLYYNHNGGQHIQSGSIDHFIKRNLS